MQTTKNVTAFVLIALFVAAPFAEAVDAKKAQYVGGTVASITEGADGVLDTKAEDKLTFTAKGGSIEIPYAAIESLEYGQKAGRRIAVAVLISPLALFSKKRKHYLTIEYKDAQDKKQAVVLELGKDIVRATLTVVATRSGKEIEYQDEEARKASKGGN